MKKILSIILSCLITTFSSISLYPVSAAEELTEYTIPVVSDIANILQLKCLSNESMMKKGVIMVSIDDVCKIADASIISDESDCILVSRNTVSWCCDYNDDDNQYLLVDINTGKGNYYESIIQQLKNDTSALNRFLDNKEFTFAPYSDYECDMKRNVYFSEQTEIEHQIIDNMLYVSFFPFLEMMGVSSEIIDDNVTERRVDILNQYNSLLNITDSNITLEELHDYYKENTGSDTYISCTLGLPIDKLYQEYYNNSYSFDLSDYYSSFDVACANIANSVGSFDGFTKTVLSATEHDSKYKESLISVITQKGNGNNETDDSYSERSEHMQNNINYEDLSFTSFDYFLKLHSKSLGTIYESNKTKIFDAFEYADNANIGFLAICSACAGYIDAIDTIEKVSELFEDDQNVLKESVLSSKTLNKNIRNENTKDILLKKPNFAPFGVAGELSLGLYNASKTENSYINFYNSAQEVQVIIEDPEITKAVNSVLEGVYSLSDDTILGAIDAAVFGNIPVSQLCCTICQIGASKLRNTPYYEEANSIASIDDYVFIQDIADDCFYENYTLEKSYYSFILCVKASLTAYIANESHGVRQDDLERILSDAVSANRGYFQTNLQYKPDLREFADIHVDLRESTTQETDSTVPVLSGRYSNDSIYVDVNGNYGEKGEIRIEYIHDYHFRSVAKYTGTISSEIKFEAEDGYGNNAYTLTFDNKTLNISIHGLSCVNQLEGWLIPDVNETLNFTSPTIPNYDISSWTNEMIIQAINNYLKNSEKWNKCVVFDFDVIDNRVYLRDQGDSEANTLTGLLIVWGIHEDYAQFSQEHSDGFGEIFHLTEYYTGELTEQGNNISRKDTHPSSTSNWKKLYYDKLQEYMKSGGYSTNTKYDLIYINDDEIPELVLCNDWNHPSQVYLFTIDQDKINDISIRSDYGCFEFIERGNCYYGEGYTNGVGGFHSSINHIEKNNRVCDIDFYTYCDETSAYYKINDKDVSKEEFEKKQTEYDEFYKKLQFSYRWHYTKNGTYLNNSTLNTFLSINNISSKQYGIVSTQEDSLNVRESPSVDSKIMGTVAKDSSITIIDNSGDWYNIIFENQEGYVSKNYVTILEYANID